MKAKFKYLPLLLFLVINLSCSFSQVNVESTADSLPPVLPDDNYPPVEIDESYQTYIRGEKIIIPEGTIGFVYVVFDAPQEKDYSCCPTCEGDSQNNLLVDIPKSKILRYSCDSRIHEKMLLEGKLQYFKGIYDDRGYLTKLDSINRYRPNEKLSIKLNGYQYHEFLSLKSAIEEGRDSIDLIFDLDSIVVVPYGFHQSFKTAVETTLNREIIGKVAGFQIGSVKDIFNLKEEDFHRF